MSSLFDSDAAPTPSNDSTKAWDLPPAGGQPASQAGTANFMKPRSLTLENTGPLSSQGTVKGDALSLPAGGSPGLADWTKPAQKPLEHYFGSGTQGQYLPPGQVSGGNSMPPAQAAGGGNGGSYPRVYVNGVLSKPQSQGDGVGGGGSYPRVQVNGRDVTPSVQSGNSGLNMPGATGYVVQSGERPSNLNPPPNPAQSPNGGQDGNPAEGRNEGGEKLYFAKEGAGKDTLNYRYPSDVMNALHTEHPTISREQALEYLHAMDERSHTFAIRARDGQDERNAQANTGNTNPIANFARHGLGDVMDTVLTQSAGVVRPFNNGLADTLADAGHTATTAYGANPNLKDSWSSKLGDAAGDVGINAFEKWALKPVPGGTRILNAIGTGEKAYEGQIAKQQNEGAAPDINGAKLKAIAPALIGAAADYAVPKLGGALGSKVSNPAMKYLLGTEMNELNATIQQGVDAYAKNGTLKWSDLAPSAKRLAGSAGMASLDSLGGSKEGEKSHESEEKTPGNSASAPAAHPPETAAASPGKPGSPKPASRVLQSALEKGKEPLQDLIKKLTENEPESEAGVKDGNGGHSLQDTQQRERQNVQNAARKPTALPQVPASLRNYPSASEHVNALNAAALRGTPASSTSSVNGQRNFDKTAPAPGVVPPILRNFPSLPAYKNALNPKAQGSSRNSVAQQQANPAADARARLAVPIVETDGSHVAPTTSFNLPYSEPTDANPGSRARITTIRRPSGVHLILDPNVAGGSAEYDFPQ